ncbi:tyrosine-type recombinase/integrase [Limnothrix sp. FACHB-708]|uniref:tyrosine-type recombinase/integrase n=1 Tax=unclassified Limnothrix TaxID=2632864 RepID=UPI00168825AB|nr:MULTISPECIES: tyrosine-type recombinase/integrase [unclassified Limnothrix]MBD2554558.1 tyrosine-type recombinase/integrase [Limnothrix sp. FACHB-708]MBD2591584.1 tyrosine-type recombinase/integrase [Limnothrix sp. FACHB-406]
MAKLGGTSRKLIGSRPEPDRVDRPDLPLSPAHERLLALWLHGKSRHTRRYYQREALRFLAFVDCPIEQVSAIDVQGFLDELERDRLAPSSMGRSIAAIKSLLRFAHQMGLAPDNPAVAFKVPSTKDTLSERILSEAQVQEMLAAEPQLRNRLMLRLLYAAGVRASELCGLCWRDLQPRGDGGQVTVYGKGNKTRAVLLPPTLWQELQAYRESIEPLPHRQDPIFRSRKGGHLDPSQLMRIVRSAAQRVGIEANVSPHWLRHAHASHSLDRGAPIHLVQATLGHASIATTGRYLHARPQDSSGRYLDL